MSPRKTVRAVNIGISVNKIDGYTIEIDEKELKAIDRYEGKLFSRIKAETGNGHQAYVYEYTGELPSGVKLVNKNTDFA